MNILVVQDANWIKKGPHTQHHLMEKLTVKGHKVVVIGYDQLWRENSGAFISKKIVYHNVSRFYKNANITYICPSFIKIPFLDYVSYSVTSKHEIHNIVNSFNPDVVVGFTSILSNYWGMYYSKKYNIPFIYYWTDIIHELVPFKPFRPIAKFIEKLIIKKSDEVIATNEELKNYMLNFETNLAHIRIFPNGVDLKRYNFSEIDSEYIRRKYNIKNNDLVLFFMGWIYEFSGLKEVILELKKAIITHPNIKLLVVGGGDYLPNLEKLVCSQEMESHVILTGERPYEEIPHFISGADICLLPAYNVKIMESIVPIKMYEYLAMNKPVISTKLNGIVKEFGHNNGVIYVDKPEDVVDKVLELSEEDIKRNGLMAKKFIAKYSWDHITSDFEFFLKSLVSEQSVGELK